MGACVGKCQLIIGEALGEALKVGIAAELVI